MAVPRLRHPFIRTLVKQYRRVWALCSALSLFSWDYETYMPHGAAKERGEICAELEALRLHLVKRLGPDIERCLHLAERGELNETERGIVRVLRRELDYYNKVPESLIRKKEKIVNEAKVAWRRAKKRASFKMFAPHLESIVDIERQIAERLGYEHHPYDALLDIYDEGTTTEDVDRVFTVLLPALHHILKRTKAPSHSPLENEQYDQESMKRLNVDILTVLGFDWNRMRIDESVHPFTESIGLYDVRVTTWYHGKDFRRSLLACIHEFGHATYDAGSHPNIWATPVQGGVSLGVHESQSRFWENIIARSYEFVHHFFPIMQKYLPFLEKYDAHDVYDYFTLVRPSPIRVEADELTYNLHIYIRYVIERQLIDGSLLVEEIPLRWDELMEKCLGIQPRNDAEGVLQDIHWSMGSIGYFPTYTLGNVISAQIYSAMRRDIDVLSLVQDGQFAPILDWLREKIHQWGAILPPKELLLRATGEKISPEHLVNYLRSKYG